MPVPGGRPVGHGAAGLDGAVLQEAKSSGGDRVVVARADILEAGTITTFDVFQGLVLAIDGKDRYTKRH